MSNADEILKLKNLLDEGIITQQEFEKLKKELLGLTNEDNQNKSTAKIDVPDNTNSKKNSEKSSNNVFLEVIGYIIGSLFIMSGFGSLLSGQIKQFILCTLIGLICLPSFMEFLNKKLNINLSRTFRFFIAIVLFIFYCVVSTTHNLTKLTANYETQSNIIFDVNAFYNEDKSNTITEDILISLKGEPANIEEWNYDVNENTSYLITTYTYYYNNGNDSEEYNFYNGYLGEIIIQKKQNFISKKDILSMFGLEFNSNSKKITDTGSALKYQNCGVKELWIQGIDKNTFNWAKIRLIELPF